MNYYVTLAFALKQIKRGKRNLTRRNMVNGFRRICRTLKIGY